MTEVEFFFKNTRAYDRFMRHGFSPCAHTLHHELLRSAPSGRVFDFEFPNFQAEFGFGDRWIRNALNRLVEAGLVKIVRKIGAGIYRLIAIYPSIPIEDLPPIENLPPSPINPKIKSIQSKTQPSNPISTFPSYIDLRDNKQEVVVTSTNEQEKTANLTGQNLESASSDRLHQDPEPHQDPEDLEPQIIEKVKAAGFKLNATLKTIVRSKAAQIVLDALQAAQEYVSQLKQKRAVVGSSEAILCKAIKDEWQPKAAPRIDPEFREWYDLARSLDIVSGSTDDPSVTLDTSGAHCVLTADGWEPYDRVRAVWSLNRLRSDLADRDRALESFRRGTITKGK